MNEKQEALNKLERQINEMAEKVLSPDWLKSFIELDLDSKIVGIGVFASMGKDEKTIEFSLAALKYYKQLTQ